MGFNSALKGLKLLKTPRMGVLNNLNNPVLNVLKAKSFARCHQVVRDQLPSDATYHRRLEVLSNKNVIPSNLV